MGKGINLFVICFLVVAVILFSVKISFAGIRLKSVPLILCGIFTLVLFYIFITLVAKAKQKEREE